MNPTARQCLENAERHMAVAQLARECGDYRSAEVAEALARSESSKARRARRERS